MYRKLPREQWRTFGFTLLFTILPLLLEKLGVINPVLTWRLTIMIVLVGIGFIVSSYGYVDKVTFHMKRVLRDFRGMERRKKIGTIVLTVLAMILVFVLYFGYTKYLEQREFEKQAEYVRLKSQLLDDAARFIDSHSFIKAAETYDELATKVDQEKDPVSFSYAKYMAGKSYLSIVEENRESGEDVILKAIMKLNEFQQVEMTENNKRYHALALEDLGYAYWRLSELTDKEMDLVKAIVFYGEASELYDTDKQFSEDSVRVRLSKSRVEYMLNEYHKSILK